MINAQWRLEVQKRCSHISLHEQKYFQSSGLKYRIKANSKLLVLERMNSYVVQNVNKL